MYSPKQEESERYNILDVPIPDPGRQPGRAGLARQDREREAVRRHDVGVDARASGHPLLARAPARLPAQRGVSLVLSGERKIL